MPNLNYYYSVSKLSSKGFQAYSGFNITLL
nr:MAG TPA: hypothetical protein [Caudoviricetes sp.]